jgi:outer membrane lipoprotein-sorting protein
MRKLFSLALILLCVVSAQAAELTVDEILAKNAEARGGLDNLKALNSTRFTGKLNMGGMELPFTITSARPEKIRVEFSVQGMTGVQAFDGTVGWHVMPFMGKKEPEQMTDDMVKELREQADFDGPFIDYAKKGTKIELLGKDKIEGTDAYKLKVTKKDGSESTIYLDAESFLEIKVEAKRKMQGQEIEGETTLGNYQEVGGILFPFSIESKAKGSPTPMMTITWDKADLNPAVADDVFTMPKKAEAAAPAAK